MSGPRRIFYDEWDGHRQLRTLFANRPRLYLAGKVHVEEMRWGAAPWIQGDPNAATQVGATCAGFDFTYTGPFVGGMCGHGSVDIEHDINQDDTFQRAVEGISEADCVVAFMDSMDAYGTMFEIGFAFGRKPLILIQHPKASAELWFAAKSAAALVVAETAAAGLEAIFAEATAGRYGGHATYSAYLASEHWQSKRAQALLRAGSKCQLCGATDDLNVHHNSYDRLGRENLNDLVVLCREHHEKFHDVLPDAKSSGGVR